MIDPLHAEISGLSPRGSACLLRSDGSALRPLPLPGGEPLLSPQPIPMPAVLASGGDLRRTRPFVFTGEADLRPLRGLIGADARCAAISPIEPPSPRGGHELYLMVWCDAGDGGLQRAKTRVADLAARLASALAAGSGDSTPAGERTRRILLAALEASSHGMVLVRPDGEVLWVNDAGKPAPGGGVRLAAGVNLFHRLCASSAERLRGLMRAAAAGAFASEELDFAFDPTGRQLFHICVDMVREPEGDLFLLSLRSLTERDRLVELLRREKNFTRSLLEAANACVLGLDVEGRAILFNKVFQELAGFRLADVLGRDAVEILVDEGRRAQWRDAHLSALGGTAVADRDFRIRTQSGAERVLCLSAGRINDDSGVCRGVLWTGREVTEERLREEGLRFREETTGRSLNQLKEFSRISSMILQEKSLDAVCKTFVDALSEVSTFGRAILTLCDEDFRGYQWYFAGLSEDEIETFHRNKLTQREKVTIFQEKYRLGNSYYIPAAEGWDYEGVRSQAGREGMVDWHPDDFLFVPLYGSNKKVVGVVSVDDPEDGCRPTAESISALELFANQVAHSIEAKKLDLEVRQTTERYRTLVETMHEGVFSVDLRERILLANAAMGSLVGVQEALINGRPLGSIMEPESLARFREATALHEGGRVARLEVELRADGGERIPVSVSVSPFKEDGALKGCFAVVRDLRHERKAESERNAMREQLAQAEKLSALGELISGIAHELNNPLTGVMGYTELLLSSKGSEGARKELGKIHTEAVRCRKIVQNLLAFARRRSPERKLIDVNMLVGETLELRAFQLRVDGVEVETRLDPQLPRTMGDFHQLQQVFVNIINNAYHALVETGRPGRLIISTEVAEDRIRVRFADNGPGIPADRIQRIFDPFFTTKPIGKGTGLGLSLSYGIIKEHEGKIQVESKVGEGATFMIDLPIHEDTQVETEDSARLESRGPVERKSILIVDDEETILDLLESVLKASGHKVETASNGKEALEKVERADYDIIISDLKMPDMGGQRLYECISEIKPHLKRRVIFSTGDTVNPVTQELFERTGNLHLAKPFRLEEVEAIIRRALDGLESADSPAALS